MQEKLELIELLLSLTEEELQEVNRRAEQELGLRLFGGSGPCHRTEV